jgi:precorrin-6B methylase 2
MVKNEKELGCAAAPAPAMIRTSMTIKTRFTGLVALLAFAAVVGSQEASAQTQTQAPPAPFVPSVGQPGKDVVWVPTPNELVEKMLDMAKVTPQDYVMDLGSGDGRNIIAAAKRGARALGVEYNPEMVTLSQRLAKEAGVSDKARFVQGDMYEADISKATVLALFLLPSNLDRLYPKFLALPPGTRIALNTFAVNEWEADATETVTDNCTSWCTALLYIVPAKVAGTWRIGGNELTLTQKFQMVSGTLVSNGTRTEVNGRLLGDQITFKAGDTEYTGRVEGNRIRGTSTTNGKQQNWTATTAP